MAKTPYTYQHYPKLVIDDNNKEICVANAKEHWKLARNDYNNDEIAKADFVPSLMDENEGQNVLSLKTKPKPTLPNQLPQTSVPQSGVNKTGA